MIRSASAYASPRPSAIRTSKWSATSGSCGHRWVASTPGPPVANGAIQIRLPDASMRRELLALHLPNPERVKANLRFASGFLHCVANLAEQSGGLSGGDILNICLNAIHAGSRDPDPAKWVVTEEVLLREIKRARAAKEKHSGRRGGRRRIGFRG